MVPSPGVRSAISSESGLTVWVWERSKVAAEVPEANQGSDGESEEPVASDGAEADGEAEPVLVDKDVRFARGTCNIGNIVDKDFIETDVELERFNDGMVCVVPLVGALEEMNRKKKVSVKSKSKVSGVCSETTL